ncbi:MULTISPECIES: hypothetical protein [Streptomyces]|uniref:Secreted protein n=1 Tax=Streptomyces griseiscabiei TaxID=2993540 RepID=A0ABU4L679_9ACTN|nr:MULTISPECIES: hypothetical protein [Streptomyces]MBZ3905523.1 hypothetical protein [Streptomyces griseiscabiei]MDX2910613.1 hypothetical protein [Streptomyces griseiscabiei]
MDESRQSPLPGAGAPRRWAVPPPALCGFLLLLALIFTVSYAVGAAAGPVAPGMRGTGTGGDSGGAENTGDSGGMGDMGATGGMRDMGGMDEGGR